MTDFTETGSVTLPYVCDDCSTGYRYAIAAAMCCTD